jgi:hypothetical protein
LEQIVLRCLAKKREDRPESARALITLLTAANDSAQSSKITRMQLAPSAGTS